MTTRPGEHPAPDEVDLLLDGEGDPGLRRHVDGCAHCQGVLDRQRAVRELLSGQAAQPPLPDEVSERWLRALASEPPFGATPAVAGSSEGAPRPGDGPSGDVAAPPDFGRWPAGVAGPPGSAAGRPDASPAYPGQGPGAPRADTRATGHPDDPRAEGPRLVRTRAPMDPRRLRRLRMAVALAAGLTVLVGAGAATWTVYTRSTPTSSAADAALPSTFAGRGESSAEDAASGAGQAAPEARQSAEAPADSAQPSDPARSAASTGLAGAAAATLSEDQVRAAVAADDLRWAGATSADEARTRAEECLRGLGTDEPVLAARPATRDGVPVQVIVSADQGRWRVTEVTPDCPPDGAPVGTTHLTP